ncbi:hypothetical protein L799_09100 [Enterobacter roggenkampii EC_38VIM1]|nr:hypothetical protein L799_09100 [Enterobacter roggenkampii EC_38VIM1]
MPLTRQRDLSHLHHDQCLAGRLHYRSHLYLQRQKRLNLHRQPLKQSDNQQKLRQWQKEPHLPDLVQKSLRWNQCNLPLQMLMLPFLVHRY